MWLWRSWSPSRAGSPTRVPVVGAASMSVMRPPSCTKMRDRELEGGVALVTGASRGIGAATAVALADAGCAVACAARATRDSPQRTPGTLDDTVDRINAAGGSAYAVPTNLAREDDVVAMVRTTVEQFGRLDV